MLNVEKNYDTKVNSVASVLFQALRTIWKNKVRAILTIVGIGLAMLCLLISFCLSESISHVQMLSLENTPKSVVTAELSGSDAQLNDRFVKHMSGYDDCDINVFYERYTDVLNVFPYSVYIEYHSIKNFGLKMTVPSVELSGATETVSLVSGRLPNETDKLSSTKCVYMNESIAYLIFGESEPLGKIIRTSNGDSYEVTGIFSDTPDVVRQVKDIKDRVAYETRYNFKVVVYTMYEERDTSPLVLANFNGNTDLMTLKTIRNDLDGIGIDYPFVTNYIEQENNILLREGEKLQTLKILLWGFSGILCLIAVAIIFFSIKERVAEIALRKSFGATTFDIIALLEFEIALTVIIASSVFLPIGVFLCIGVSLKVMAQYATVFVGVNAMNVILTLFITLLATLIASIIPILFIVKSRIVDALRFG